MGNFEKCIELCDEAITKGKEIRADIQKIARAMSRKGLALVELGQLDEGINMVKASLLETNDDKLKFKLRDLEKLKKNT